MLNVGPNNAEIVVSNQQHRLINVPSSRLVDRNNYKLDVAVNPQGSGKSIYNSFQSRMVVATTSKGGDSKAFDSSPHLTVFEEGPSYRMHTYNTRKSLIQSQDTFADSLKRLSDVRLAID